MGQVQDAMMTEQRSCSVLYQTSLQGRHVKDWGTIRSVEVPLWGFAFAQKKNKSFSTMPQLISPLISPYKRRVRLSVYRLHRPFAIANNTISVSGFVIDVAVGVVASVILQGNSLRGCRLRPQHLGIFDLDLDGLIVF